MRTHVSCLLAVALPCLATASPRSDRADKPVVYVPVPPYEYMLERIGGDLVEVHSIVGKGDDPHQYSPTPKQVAALAGSDLLFSGELSFEGNFFVKVSDGPDAPKGVNLLEGLDLLDGSCEVCEAEVGEAKGSKSHGHSHDDLKDPHVWLSPTMLRQQAARVASILKDEIPSEHHSEIDANLRMFQADLEAVDQELKEVLEPFRGESFYVYHGAFAYFAQRYGLQQVAIETGNRRPTPKHLERIIKQAKEDNVRLVFVQPQFDQSSAKALAKAIVGEVALLDPLEKDVLANLRYIARSIRDIQ